MHFASVFFVLVTLGLPLALAVDPLVNLGYTQYLGTAQSNNISSWLGMRYAAPPLGDLRFRAPVAPLQNDTVQMADAHGLICLATNGSPTSNTTSEDCLFMDVYAPSNATATSMLPVYFFIQGGGYNANSNANYRGDGLIESAGMNIVVVNFNYRVGLYGFLASQEVVENGNTNVGLLDQRMAMQWVQQYISLFGGNPGHVVLGGCSAGAGSIALHLTAYGGRDDGLFQAAAAESVFFPAMLTIPQSQYQYDALIERVGCGTATDTLSCLRQVNATYLQENNFNLPFPGSGLNASIPLYMYDPVIDGGIIMDYTYRLFHEGKFIKVPVIFGDDTNEGTEFTPRNTSTAAEMDLFLKSNYPVLTAYELELINDMYPEGTSINGTGVYYEPVSNVYGQMCFTCPGVLISSAYSAYSTRGSWSYRYNVLDPTQAAEGYGVPHTVEINAIWGPDYVAPGAAPASYYTTNAGIIPVIRGYWTSFILAMNPNPYRMEGTPIWQEWSQFTQDRLLFVTNSTTMETVTPDLREECAYLTSLRAMGYAGAAGTE